MGHIVLAAPGIGRFHLHDRLARALHQRGHRVEILCGEPAERTFWRHQELTPLSLPTAPAATDLPWDELAPTCRRGRRRQLGELAGGVRAWLAGAAPDLVVLHQDRGDVAQVLQFVARAAGCRVLWTGDGLLPHTLQLDERGLDGEASCARRSAGAFRVVRGEPELLHACLAHALAGSTPFGLPRTAVRVPRLGPRLADAWTTWPQQGLVRALASFGAWRQARPSPQPPIVPWAMPEAPFLAVLLQPAHDPRLTIDGGPAPAAAALVQQTARAAACLGKDVAVCVVAADNGPARRFAGQPMVPAAAAAVAAATALATVTVNHPLASVALLAGTPVVHTGAALYGVRGVARRSAADQIAEGLGEALAHDHPTLRQRFLSWVFRHGHVWCSATEPDWNGLTGLVAAIEARLAVPAGTEPGLRYRSGPAWPLAGETRRP